ncbi:hypothetical protein AKJ16_DCAP04664 [Drosera capensis]
MGWVGSRASSVSVTSIDDACSVEACETTATTGDYKSGAHLCYKKETESESVGDRESDRTAHSCDQIFYLQIPMAWKELDGEHRERQAIIELFMRMERERHKEIEGLAAHQAVSKFSQRGRIQAMLRLRFLRLDKLAEDQQCLLPRSAGLVRTQHKSSLINQRERLTEAFEPDNAKKKSLPTVISKCN